MGLTERHWFENEEPELTDRQLEDAVSIQDRVYRRGYHKGYSDGVKEQEAVKPLPQKSNGWVRTIKLWYCGSCHSKISRRTSKYCPNCGKPILWEGR